MPYLPAQWMKNNFPAWQSAEEYSLIKLLPLSVRSQVLAKDHFTKITGQYLQRRHRRQEIKENRHLALEHGPGSEHKTRKTYTITSSSTKATTESTGGPERCLMLVTSSESTPHSHFNIVASEQSTCIFSEHILECLALNITSGTYFHEVQKASHVYECKEQWNIRVRILCTTSVTFI